MAATLATKLAVIERFTERVLARDGPDCWYCGIETTEENRTLEHLLAISHGGNYTMANLCLACRPCNTQMGNHDIVAKVKYRESRRNASIAALRANNPDPPPPPSPDALAVAKRADAMRHRAKADKALAAAEVARLAAERREQHRRERAQRERDKAQVFIDVVRGTVSRDEFTGLWNQVDQRISFTLSVTSLPEA